MRDWLITKFLQDDCDTALLLVNKNLIVHVQQYALENFNMKRSMLQMLDGCKEFERVSVDGTYKNCMSLTHLKR